MIKIPLNKTFVHILLIIIIGLLAYSNTFKASFHFDDRLNIIENPLIKDLMLYVDPSKVKELKGVREYSTFKQRYIGSLSFALNYKLHGLNVTGYHVVNLLIHIINALLVYLLVIFSFKTPFLYKSRTKGYSGYIAVFTALLFVSHPLQTQAVTYIVQRLASLTTLFYLLSIILYIKARLASTSASILTCYAASLFSAVLAMKTKEIAFTLPIIIVLYESMFLGGNARRKILYLIPFLLTMLIIPLGLIGTDEPIGDLIGNVSEATQVQSISRLDYLFTEFRVLVTYMRLIVLPINQNLDYDYPVFHSFFHPAVFISFMVLSAIFVAGVYVLYRFKDSAMPVRFVSFGIFWFFITLSVESGIIPLQVIYEHRMYLPSIGVFLTVSTILFIAIERLKVRWKGIERTVIPALLLVVVVLAGATYARNMVWKDEITLWEDVVKKSPEKERAHNNLGVAYDSRGFIEKSIKYYKNAIQLNPDLAEAHNNLGFAYYSQGLIDKAIERYQIVNRIAPAFADAYVNLGVAYESQGFIDNAIENYRIAIKLKPGYAQAHFNLGNAYRHQGLINKAIEQYQIAVKLNPGYFEAHYNLAEIYRSKGLHDKAIEPYRIAIKLKPDYANAYLNLGLSYYARGLLDKAIDHYRIAVKLKPDYANAHNNLGVAYQSKGLLDKAAEHYTIALKLKQAFPQAHYNLGIIYQSKGLIDKTIEHYKIAITLEPEWETPHFELGRIYLQKRDTEKAGIEFRKVLQINPQHQGARKFHDSITRENDNS